MMGGNSRVVLGRISGLYGVKGWVRIYSYTSPRSNILNYSTWFLGRGEEWERRGLEAGRPHGKGVVAKIAGCDDRDQAASLVHREIAVERSQLPEAAPGEYYWADLQGLKVVTPDGVDLGVIDRLFETGANDVIVVKGDRERLIPFLQGDVVRAVDLTEGVMTVDWDPAF